MGSGHSAPVYSEGLGGMGQILSGRTAQQPQQPSTPKPSLTSQLPQILNPQRRVAQEIVEPDKAATAITQKRPQPSTPTPPEPPIKIGKTFGPNDSELERQFKDPVLETLNQPYPSVNNISSSVQSIYEGLKSMGSNDPFNHPATTKSSQFELAKIENTLDPDYVSSNEYEQFQSNLQFLTDRNLISAHEVKQLISSIQQSKDPVEDFLQGDSIQGLSRQVVQNKGMIQQAAMDHQSILQIMHEPLNAATMAILISGMVEHSHIEGERKQSSMQALKQEAARNSILKQALDFLQSSYQQTGNSNPSQSKGAQRPSYTGEKLPPQNESGGKGVQQSTTHLLESGATNIIEGYGSYKTGGQLASAAQKAQSYIQGEGAVSEIIGSEAAQSISTGLAEAAPVLEGLGEVGAAVAVASGVNDLLTAIGVTHENYINEAINYVENTVEDAFDNVYHKVGDFFSNLFS
jgi:hypothetical protein